MSGQRASSLCVLLAAVALLPSAALAQRAFELAPGQLDLGAGLEPSFGLLDIGGSTALLDGGVSFGLGARVRGNFHLGKGFSLGLSLSGTLQTGARANAAVSVWDLPTLHARWAPYPSGAADREGGFIEVQGGPSTVLTSYTDTVGTRSLGLGAFHYGFLGGYRGASFDVGGGVVTFMGAQSARMGLWLTSTYYFWAL